MTVATELYRYSRHDVAYIDCIAKDVFPLCLYLICSYQYLRMACYRWADDGVWSPSDNIPKWDETVRWNPIRKSHPVKGYGQNNKVKLIEESYAPLGKYRSTETNRSKRVSLCLHEVIRLQVSNVPVRNCWIIGVQISPKLFVMVNYVERGNVTSPPCAMQGRHNRKACCWSGGIDNVEKAKVIL